MQSAEVVLGVLRDHWRATCIERCPRGSEGSRTEKDLSVHDRYLAVRLTRCYNAKLCLLTELRQDPPTWSITVPPHDRTGRANTTASPSACLVSPTSPGALSGPLTGNRPDDRGSHRRVAR